MTRDGICWLALAGLTLAQLVANQSFVRHDHRPAAYDEAWYLETSLELYHSVVDSDWPRFWYHYKYTLGPKAPLIAVLPLPFYLLFGPHYKPALLVNSGLLVLSNLFLFLLARRLYSTSAGLLAVLFYQTMPLVYGLSRTYLTEYGLATLVLMWVYFLLASERLTRNGINLLLGVLLGLGLLVKVLFPAFIAGPLLVVWWQARRSGSGSVGALATILLTGLVVASTWYKSNWASAVQFAWGNAYGEIAAGYGTASPLDRAVRFLNEGTSLAYAVAFAVLVPLSKLRRCRPSPLAAQAAHRRRLLLLAWFLPPLAAIAVGRNLEIRFLAPLLPVQALWLAAAVVRVTAKPVAVAVLGLAVAALPLRLYAGHSHPALAPRTEVRLGAFVLSGSRLGLARVPDREGDWGQQRILEALERLNPAGPAPRYAIVGVEHPFLNANLLRYLNISSRYNWRFTSLGYAETSADRALERLYTLDPYFVIVAEGFHEHDLPPFLNRINADIQARLDHSELPFHLRAKVHLTPEVSAVLYEREAPWTSFAPGASFEPPSHPQVADFPGGVRLLGYDWKRRRGQLADISYYWTVPHAVPEDYRVHVEFARGPEVFLRQDYLITSGRHPVFEWSAGEVVKQTMTVYAPAEGALEARVWLTGWSRQEAQAPVVLLRLDE